MTNDTSCGKRFLSNLVVKQQAHAYFNKCVNDILLTNKQKQEIAGSECTSIDRKINLDLDAKQLMSGIGMTNYLIAIMWLS
jgi:hypothetical protein